MKMSNETESVFMLRKAYQVCQIEVLGYEWIFLGHSADVENVPLLIRIVRVWELLFVLSPFLVRFYDVGGWSRPSHWVRCFGLITEIWSPPSGYVLGGLVTWARKITEIPYWEKTTEVLEASPISMIYVIPPATFVCLHASELFDCHICLFHVAFKVFGRLG